MCPLEMSRHLLSMIGTSGEIVEVFDSRKSVTKTAYEKKEMRVAKTIHERRKGEAWTFDRIE
jgi:hypothetical protein